MRKLSQDAGLSPGGLQKILKRGSKRLDPEKLRAIALAAGVAENWLLTGEGDPDGVAVPPAEIQDLEQLAAAHSAGLPDRGLLGVRKRTIDALTVGLGEMMRAGDHDGARIASQALYDLLGTTSRTRLAALTESIKDRDRRSGGADEPAPPAREKR